MEMIKFDLMVVILLCLNISIDKGTDIMPNTTVHFIATQPHVLDHYRTIVRLLNNLSEKVPKYTVHLLVWDLKYYKKLVNVHL